MLALARWCLVVSLVFNLAAPGVTSAKTVNIPKIDLNLDSIPLLEIIRVASKLATTSQSADSKTITLDYIRGDSKVQVADARFNVSVTKWQEEIYGSITIKTDVVARVTYTVDLKQLQLRWDDERKCAVIIIPPIQVDAIEYLSWNPTVSFTRVRKWFSSDTRAALETQIRNTIRSETREEAEKYLTEVRVNYLSDLRSAFEEKIKELSPGIKIILE